MIIIKHLVYFLFVLLAISCEEADKAFVFPKPSVIPLSEIPNPISQEAGNAIFQDFSLQSAEGLQKFEIFQDNELLETVTFTNEFSITHSFQYEIPSTTENGTMVIFDFLLTDQKERQATAQVRLNVNTTFFVIMENINGTDVTRLKGRLNNDYILSNENTYVIDSTFSVENNSTLTIEKGSTVYFKTFDNQSETSRLVITQGAKIMAEGTANEPIVFTSDKLLKGEIPQPTDWGGVIVYGRAPSNQGSVILDEGFRYGGDAPNDNSGILRYIRNEYAGNALENSEHAFRFFGVGSDTQVDHLQVYRNYNIAFRLRGGRVNLKYISAIGHGGYGLWGDGGWQGMGQFWLFQTDVAATLVPVNYWNIARSIEMRSDDNDFSKPPRTMFTVSNVTCIGNGFEEGVDKGTRRGVRFRTGSIGTFQNAVITGFPNDAARVEDLDIEVLGIDMIFDNIRSFNNSKNYEQEARTIFFESGDYNVSEEAVPGISLASFVGSVPSLFNPTSLGSFFTSASYIGAIESTTNDWTTEGIWFKDINGSIR